MVLEHIPVGSRCTIIFEKSLGMRNIHGARSFVGDRLMRGTSTFEGIGVKVQV